MPNSATKPVEHVVSHLCPIVSKCIFLTTYVFPPVQALCSILIMFVIQWVYALANIIVALVLFLYIGKASPGLPIGDYPCMSTTVTFTHLCAFLIQESMCQSLLKPSVSLSATQLFSRTVRIAELEDSATL